MIERGLSRMGDTHRMRRKLEVGLDAVLAEEGAEPLSKASAEK